MKYTVGTIIVFSALLMLIPGIATAIMVYMPIEALTRASDVVIEGEVIDTHSFWSQDGSTILTRAEIVVNEVIDGHLSQTRIAVEYEGGEVGEIGLRVSDAVTMQAGEQVVLFLKAADYASRQAVNHVVEKVQGKFSIQSGGMAARGAAQYVGAAGSAVNQIELSELKKRIRSARE